MIIKLIIIILFMFFSVFIEEVYKTKKNRNEKKNNT